VVTDCENDRRPSTPQQLNVRFPGTPEHRANLNAKYTFTNGALNGGYVGGGILAQSSTIGELTADWTDAIRVAGFVDASAFFGYGRAFQVANSTLG